MNYLFVSHHRYRHHPHHMLHPYHHHHHHLVIDWFIIIRPVCRPSSCKWRLQSWSSLEVQSPRSHPHHTSWLTDMKYATSSFRFSLKLRNGRYSDWFHSSRCLHHLNAHCSFSFGLPPEVTSIAKRNSLKSMKLFLSLSKVLTTKVKILFDP